MLWRTMLCLSLGLGLAACGGASPEIRSLDCKPSLGTACSAQVPGGSRVEFELQNFREGEEYVFILFGEDEAQPERVVRNRFQVTSTHTSRYVSEEERNESEQLARRTPSVSPENTRYSQIPIANNLLVNHSPLVEDLYVPQVEDYYTYVEGKRRMYNLRYHSNPEISGERISPRPLYSESGQYSVLVDSELSSEAADPEEFKACLDRSLGKLFEITGPPLDVDGVKEFAFLITPMYSSLGKVAGLFNYLDLFSTYKGERIPDSNAQDVVYLSPNLKELTCAVGIHEMQHRLRFEYSVYRQIPPEDRHELESILRYGLEQEMTSLNEGLSHTVEELAEAAQQVGVYASSFLKNPDGSSMSLEHAEGSRLENYRTRGFAYSLIQYALARGGGRLDFDDKNTQEMLRYFIRSPEVGLKSIAKYFGLEPHEFLEEYFVKLASSLFQGSQVTGLLPPVEQTEEGITRGIEILPRDASVEEWNPTNKRSIHPLSVGMRLLPRARSFTLRPKSIRIFRYIVPDFEEDRRTGEPKVVFKSNESPYSVFAIRVR